MSYKKYIRGKKLGAENSAQLVDKVEGFAKDKSIMQLKKV